MAARPFKIIVLPGSMIAFSVKVRPAHSDLPALSTIGASGTEAPALSIGSPDVSEYVVPGLCTSGSNQSEPYHK